MALEDYREYTEVDPNHHISVSKNHIDFNCRNDETAYVYKDKGVNHFGDFTHLLQIKANSFGLYSFGCVWALANDLENCWGFESKALTALSLRFFSWT
ncbi:unnamed protein product, partial [marine sediment metagenome]